MTRRLRRAVLRREGRKKDWERQLSNFVFLLLFPALIGLAGAFTSSIAEWNGTAAIAMWILIVLFFGLFFWRADPAGRSLMGLLQENEALDDRIETQNRDLSELKQSINLLLWQSHVSLSSRLMVAQYVRDGIGTKPQLQEAIGELLTPLYLEGEALFGLGGSERWSFGVYMYSQQSDVLLPIWRERAPKHPSSGPGREWGRGEGHVGKAFVNGEPIITADALHPDVEPLSVTPLGKTSTTDPQVYRSFAAIPIGPLFEDQSKPYGVLVGTSDRVGRFDKENTFIMVHLADVLATLFQLSKINIDGIVNTDCDMSEAPEKGE